MLTLVKYLALLVLNFSSFTLMAEEEQDYLSLHGQFTSVTQYHPKFPSTSEGPNSLASHPSAISTNDMTLYTGVRLWQGSEFFINPELDQGFGFNNTLGVAGFPSGEAYKVGKGTPYFRLPRAFLRQTFNLGGDLVELEDQANQFKSGRTTDNVILTIGKFSVVDVFDTNAYAHDPRADFLNWSVLESGAFDYAADSWGYSDGVALELSKQNWTIRAGLFAMSKIPNGQNLDTSFRQYEDLIEIEERHNLSDHAGKLKVLVFDNHADMGSYNDAIKLSQGGIPSTAPVRKYQSRAGVAMNLEQELSEGLGLFTRLSFNDGTKETFDFTDINKSIATGVFIDGKTWSRADDSIGLAVVINGLFNNAKEYFKAGGLGPLIGDGPHPNYSSEQILEAFYSLQAVNHLNLTFDYQHINNPAYNPDRGPVNVLSFRMHSEF